MLSEVYKRCCEQILEMLFRSSLLFFFVGFLFCLAFFQVSSLVKFSNLKCKSFDKSFADFTKCQLKARGRDKIALSINVELYKIPVTNVSVNLSLWKKASGYRPFLYNRTWDFCEFMKRSTQRSLLSILFTTLKENSNINHTCPFDHDIVIDNFILSDQALRLLPVPSGDYMVQVKVAAYNDWKADVKAYVVVVERF